MSGYLSKLALRSRQQTPSIRPRLASLFEPVSDLRVASFNEVITETEPANVLTQAQSPVRKEIETHESRTIRTPAVETAKLLTPAPAVSEVSVATSPQTTVPLSPVNAATRDEKQDDKAAPQTASVAAEATPVVDARNDGSPVHERTLPETLLAHVVETRIIESLIQSDPPAATAETRRTEPRSSGVPVIVRPGVTAVPPPEPATETEAPETASSIRITIGRVEVRAVMPSPVSTAVAASRPKPPSALSLEEYLKKRSGE